MKNKLTILIFALITIVLSSCNNQVRNIPAGYVGKLLTPTGWQSAILEAGQIDIGQEANNGTSNNLVLLEVTTTTIKE